MEALLHEIRKDQKQIKSCVGDIKTEQALFRQAFEGHEKRITTVEQDLQPVRDERAAKRHIKDKIKTVGAYLSVPATLIAMYLGLARIL